jgi:hypothetical protein
MRRILGTMKRSPDRCDDGPEFMHYERGEEYQDGDGAYCFEIAKLKFGEELIVARLRS